MALIEGMKGCGGCRKIGLKSERELRNLLAAGAYASQLREAAIRAGMTTMFADGMAKVLAGETAAEEVARVLGHTG